MKKKIIFSIPSEMDEKAKALAEKLGLTKSGVFKLALAEKLEREANNHNGQRI